MDRPRIDFFTKIFLRPVENWIYEQLRGLDRSDVGVAAEAGENLSEFPVDTLFLVHRHRFAPRRVGNALKRLVAGVPEWPHLPESSVRVIERYWRVRRPDVVYCTFGWNAVRLIDVPSIRDGAIPFVVFVGGSDITAAVALGDHYVSALHEAFDRAASILATSKFLEKKLIEFGAPKDKANLHYIGVQVPGDVQRETGDEPVRLLAAARFIEVKGVAYTIRAFARASREIPNAVLEIFGDGPEKAKCVALARELGMADRISFRGLQPASVVHSSMQYADIFVQHSVKTDQGHEEALGLVFLEAAARGVPVIGTRSGGIPETVVEGETGILVGEKDVDAMAQAMVELVEDIDLRRRYGANGRRMVEERFDRRIQNRRLEETLLDAANS